MAKKKRAKKKQTRIPETFDPVPDEVQDAADDYVEAKREQAAWREKTNGRKELLIEKMREHDVTELDIDDGEKRIVLEEGVKVKIKKKSDPKPDTSDADEAFE